VTDDELYAERIEDHTPVQDGVRAGQVDEQDGDSPDEKQQSQAATLQDLVEDGVVLFTPALVTTHGGFDRDPVVEFARTVSTTDPDILPFVIDSEFQFFEGLGLGLLPGSPLPVNWNNRLYGVNEETWPELKNMMENIAWYDPKRYNFGQVGSHELTIVDPHALARGFVAEIPSVTITVFCVSALRGFYYINPATDPPRTLPTVVTNPPDPALVAEAQSVLGPPPDPTAIRNRQDANQN